jgi:hypothetical protein
MTVTVDCGKGHTMIQLRDPNTPDFSLGLGATVHSMTNSSVWKLVSAKPSVCSGIRSAFGRITTHLASLAFEDKPDYDLLRTELRNGLKVMVFFSVLLLNYCNNYNS